MRRFEPKLSILPFAQQILWESLAFTKDLGLVLYDGTAIALQLGHRESVDFDFFAYEPLDKNSILRNLSDKHIEIFQDTENSLSMFVTIPQGIVKLSFFGGIDIGRIHEPLLTQDEVLIIADKHDLLATKLKTIHQRVERKDYVDIIALLKDGLSLENGLVEAQTLYGNTLSEFWTLKALTYFDSKLRLSNDEKNYLIRAAETVSMNNLENAPKPEKIMSLTALTTDL